MAVHSASVGAFRLAFEKEAAALKAELGAADPDFAAALSPYESPNALLRPRRGRSSASILAVLGGLPNGLQAMEPDMPGLVRTSLNLGRLSSRTEAGVLALSALVMVRSSSDEEKEALARAVESRLDGAADDGLAGAAQAAGGRPRLGAEPRKPPPRHGQGLLRRGLRQGTPRSPRPTGASRCALFKPRFPDWDMISLGPKILYPHSPDERMEIASVERSYRFVKELVGTLA